MFKVADHSNLNARIIVLTSLYNSTVTGVAVFLKPKIISVENSKKVCNFTYNALRSDFGEPVFDGDNITWKARTGEKLTNYR